MMLSHPENLGRMKAACQGAESSAAYTDTETYTQTEIQTYIQR